MNAKSSIIVIGLPRTSHPGENYSYLRKRKTQLTRLSKLLNKYFSGLNRCTDQTQN